MNELIHERLREIDLGTLRGVGLLGRWRPISGHLAASSKLGAKEKFSRHRFGHARLANSLGLLAATVEAKLSRDSTRDHPESS